MSQAPGAKVPFNNPTSQAERAATLREMHSVVSPEAGGRFAQRMIEHINTRGPTLEYPRLPAGSPWSSDPVGLEPPFPEDISYVPPCGEPHEAEAAARLLSVEPVGLLSPLPGADADPLPPRLPLGSANLAGSSPPTSAPQPPDVVAETARPFSNSAQPSIADASREGRTRREERSKAGRLTRRFGK
jgi:hypothetical protein